MPVLSANVMSILLLLKLFVEHPGKRVSEIIPNLFAAQTVANPCYI